MNLVLQGKVNGKTERGRLRLSYVDNISNVTGLPFKAIFRTVGDMRKVEKCLHDNDYNKKLKKKASSAR